MIDTKLFGSIEVDAEQMLSIPDGLIGFPECRSFAVLPAGPEGFFWLQSVDHATLAFLLVDPFLNYDGYTVDLNGPLLARLGTQDAADVNVYAIVTLAGSGDDVTANLQGPVIFNVATRQGFQAVLQDSEFGTRVPLDLNRLAAH
jgi:flagellar assembly factor FliW